MIFTFRDVVYESNFRRISQNSFTSLLPLEPPELLPPLLYSGGGVTTRRSGQFGILIVDSLQYREGFGFEGRN